MTLPKMGNGNFGSAHSIWLDGKIKACAPTHAHSSTDIRIAFAVSRSACVWHSNDGQESDVWKF